MEKMPSTKYERRHSTPQTNVLWAHLNTSQQAAVSSLSHFGYELSYIRIYDTEETVILTLGDQVATIDKEGNIDPSPEIKVRS
ncbi:MAG: hypothetical protein MJK12_08365 [Colwellia sp.]|nr:hypothetical protein [Colwellia sp.]